MVLDKGKGDSEQRGYAQKMWDRLQVDKTPTIFLLSSDGWMYARTGFNDATTFNKEIADFVKQRKPAIADLGAKLSAAPDDPDLIEQITDRGAAWGLLVGDYFDLKMKLAQAKGPIRAQHLAEIARYYHDQREIDKYKTQLKQVRAADARVAQELEVIIALQTELTQLYEKRQWEAIKARVAPYAAAKGNLLQEAQYWAASAEYYQDRMEKALELYEKARAAAPRGHRALQAAGAIQHIKWKLGIK